MGKNIDIMKHDRCDSWHYHLIKILFDKQILIFVKLFFIYQVNFFLFEFMENITVYFLELVLQVKTSGEDLSSFSQRLLSP